MPHPALVSSALYRINDFPAHLVGFKMTPNAAGYGKLRARVEARKLVDMREIPTARTVQDMLTRSAFAKYQSCLGIAALIDDERRDLGQPALGAALVEENEFYLPKLQKLLEEAGRGTAGKGALSRAIEKLCMAHGFHTVMIHSMCKGFLTTKQRCEVVASAVKTEFSIVLVPSNEPIRDPKSNRVAAEPIPNVALIP